MHNSTLQERLDNIQAALDAMAHVVDHNLCVLLGRLTGDPNLATKVLYNIADEASHTRQHCLLLVARQQPMANDLKYAMAALRTGQDYERIQELLCAFNERLDVLCGSSFSDVLADMTGMVAEILKLHDVVRGSWRRSVNELPLPNLKTHTLQVCADIDDDLLAVQHHTMERIADESNHAELCMELILACQHLKRIARIMADIPEEMLAFDLHASSA